MNPCAHPSPGGLRLRPSFILGGITVLLFLISTGGAHHCTTYSTSRPEVDTGHYYVDNDFCQWDGCMFSVWIYEESNGIPGLQRGDEVVDDTCHGMIDSDTFPCMLLPVALMTPRRNAKDRCAGGAALAATALVGGLAFVPTADAC